MHYIYFIQTFLNYVYSKLVDILKLLTLKNETKPPTINAKKKAEEGKTCMKVQNEKAIEHNKQNIFKFQTKPEIQNSYNFVTLNKRKTCENFGGKMLENAKEFGNKGFIILVFLL